ncbi:unnamed protein product [Paramecium sonneborni]|uniref:Uncharacterized protein n=1 Tax=Paramecium sonneborni TaxID=65129 RepID=A0A8S1MAC2_9CILI|nr:unnamed protein product [Paramecium sonneborni]
MSYEQSALIATGTTAAIVGGAQAGITAAGFSSIGPVAGSLAAATQASIGNVVAGSAFAVVQGVAMTGVVSTLLLPATIIGLGAGIFSFIFK